MKIFNKKILANILMAFIICLPTVSFAKEWTDNFFPIIQCGSEKPCDFSDAVDTVARVINWFISIAASLGAATLAYAGIQILMNPGNAGKISEARTMFNKTLFGLFWLLAAWVVIYTLVNTFVDDKIGALRFLK
jgi:hypothetical protein